MKRNQQGEACSLNSAIRNSVRAAQGHDGQVVVPGRSGAEVRNIAQARADERGGQEFVLLAEQAAQTLGCVFFATVVARLGESVGEEEERVARLHSESFGRELLVAENSDGES